MNELQEALVKEFCKREDEFRQRALNEITDCRYIDIPFIYPSVVNNVTYDRQENRFIKITYPVYSKGRIEHKTIKLCYNQRK